MFRFIHAADVHLDSPLRGLSRYDGAPVEALRGATRRAFERLVDFAIHEEVAFVLLAGDLYDGDWRDFNTGIFMSRQLGRLAEHGIQIVAVAGNHDAASRLTKALQLPGNMKLLSSRGPETVTLDAVGVAIHGQSFARDREETNLAAGYPDALAGLFNIGLLHTSLDGREGHAPYSPCTLDDLRARGYEYWALGHVHKPEIVSSDPWIVYPGCLQGRHAREDGAKGCVLVTVQDDVVVEVTPYPLDDVRWTCCPVKLQDATSISEVLDRVRGAIQDKLKEADGRVLAARVVLEGATSCSEKLLASPEQVIAQVRMLGAELGEDLWIEKVLIHTTTKRSLEAVLNKGGPFATLLETIKDAEGEPASIPGIAEVIEELKRKLPPEARGPDSGLDLDDPAVIQRLVHEARQLLVGRLLEEGDAA
jgi:DNA repair protein SbcD/Mre11